MDNMKSSLHFYIKIHFHSTTRPYTLLTSIPMTYFHLAIRQPLHGHTMIFIITEVCSKLQNENVRICFKKLYCHHPHTPIPTFYFTLPKPQPQYKHCWTTVYILVIDGSVKTKNSTFILGAFLSHILNIE